MESLRNAFKLLKKSIGLNVLNEAETAIRRVASGLGISEDKATVLLVFFPWDESRIDSEYLPSIFFVSNPDQLNPSMMNCPKCGDYAICVNLGCGHYCCENCFKEHIEAKILAGELDLLCPIFSCLKYLSHERIRRLLSDKKALATYHLRLYESWRSAQPQDSLQDSLLTKMVALLRKGTELGCSVGNSLGYSNKQLLFLAILVVITETKSRLRI